MNKNLTKLITSAAVALAMGSSVSAQSQNNKACPPAPFEQGYGINNDKFPAAYNAPARIDVQQSWDFFFTGTFTYWYVNEAGCDLGFTTSDVDVYPIDGSMLFQNNTYSPGFKVGVGMDFGYDSWVGFAEYTWLRNNSTQTLSAGSGVILASNFIANGAMISATPFAVGDVSTSRHVNLDMIDATLSRPFYEGRKLTLLPYSGIRAAWLRQNLRLATTRNDTGLDIVSHNKSNSWLVGPRAGMAAHWLLGWGFRFEGDVGASVLFQQYKATNRMSRLTDITVDHEVATGTQNQLAPVADMGLGLGWGTYLDRQNYHLDFVATYDFMNWWGLNFMRANVDSLNARTGAEPGSLQVSGLTLTGRFDF